MQFQKFRFVTKLFVVWCLFLIQLILFGLYWFYQQEHVDAGTESFLLVSNINKAEMQLTEKQDDFVYFVTKKSSELINLDRNYSNTKLINLESHTNFEDDFVIFRESGPSLKENITCYREGTILDWDDDINSTNHQKYIRECHCKAEWHGKDCSQPEIIWRALMTSKQKSSKQHNLYDKYTETTNINKIIYMITGYFISLEILEIQLNQLSKSVDFFILCQKRFKENDSLLAINNKINKEPIGKRLKLKLPSELYNRILIFDQLSVISQKNSLNKTMFSFTSKLAYKEFKKRLISTNNINPNDIFIFSEDDEILNDKAVKYFQFFNGINKNNQNRLYGVAKFRLKYNVYGFYWQHPIGTKISGALCTIKDLEMFYKSDPERLLNVKKPSLLIGDLNHIGGWYCQYCYQPDEIIDKLFIEYMVKKSKNSLVPFQNSDITALKNVIASKEITLDNIADVIFPKQFKNSQIDTIYIQNLIANGLYIDGKLGLTKQYRYSDKYYSPEYVTNNSWRFNNILANTFVSLNDDYDY